VLEFQITTIRTRY